ncbi:MAG: MBL fold metallo-hydrolase [Promethearchaeati archaeon SRVP18_Atabeyarchaeia-1]
MLVDRDHTATVSGLKGLDFQVLWYDSLGAKSSSVLVWTPDVSILIDPGASGMQKGFPMSRLKKALYRLRALRRISEAARKAQVIVISHYHYDHYCRVNLRSADCPSLYRGKLVLAKNPNQFINFSQWARARTFFSQILGKYRNGAKLDEFLTSPQSADFGDPEETMQLAMSKDFKGYQQRRNEILERGRNWFKSLCRMWSSNKWIPELNFGNTKFMFTDDKKVEIGNTVLRFSPPLFHGVEYDRLGWVSSTVVEHNGVKLLHSSDFEGPVIEDYADWIIRENPDVLFIDGPPTYLYGVVVGRTAFARAIDNACRIIREADRTKLMIYDHHLMRDPLFRERVADVYKVAKENGKRVTSAAEYLGQEVVALKVRGSPRNPRD